MAHWIAVTLVIEAMAGLAWIAAAVTGRLKFAFVFGFNVFLPVAWLHLASRGGLDWRGALALASVALYLVDMNVVVLLWSRDTAVAKLDRALGAPMKSILPLVMANATGWIYCLPFLGIARRAGPFDGLDAAAIAVYAAGTLIHAAADWQKRRFKARPGARGRVLDAGLWRLSRHPNYFGDALVYVAWALLAADPLAWLSPALNVAQYLFDAIPKNEAWAAETYGAAWADYARRTSRLIPWPPGRPRA